MKRSTELIAYGASAAAGIFTWLGLGHLRDAQTDSAKNHNTYIETCLESSEDLSLQPECLKLIKGVEIRIGDLATHNLRPELDDANVRASLISATRETWWDESIFAPELAGGTVTAIGIAITRVAIRTEYDQAPVAEKLSV